MNREIKFRAWDNAHKQFDDTVCANLLQQLHEPTEDVDSEYGSRFFLMQYTGLKDKNGKEIYEGDIIYVHEYYEKRYGIIVPDLEKTGFKIKWLTETEFNDTIYVRIENIEVVGNIFENPELLNQIKINKY